MSNDDFPEPEPSDRLGRMLVLSMVFHVALFGGLVWFNVKSPKVKPVLPTYTVDLVNMPLPAPAPGPKTDQPSESPLPSLVPKPGVEVREKPGPPVSPAPKPKMAEERKPLPVEKKPVIPMKPAESPPPAKTEPIHPKVTPKVAVPPKPEPKPVALAPKPSELPAPVPAVKPATTLKKPVEPKATGETKALAEKVKKPAPPAPEPVAKAADPKARERQIAQEINASQQKVADSSRDQKIQESVHNLEKGLAAKSRNQAYQEAVGQAAARLSAGKVSAKISHGGGGSTAGGSMGSAQTAVYGSQVSQMVRSHWQPNCLQRSNMHHLKAVIIVRIQANGTISASWFEKESGDRLFDQSAMSAVTRSSPLPALPPGQEQVEIGITFTPEWKASS